MDVGYGRTGALMRILFLRLWLRNEQSILNFAALVTKNFGEKVIISYAKFFFSSIFQVLIKP